MKSFIFLIMGLQVSVAVFAQIEPSVALDPASGNYVIRYEGEAGNLVELTFEPATKIDPNVRAIVQLDSDLFKYEYTVSSGPASKQRILNFSVRLFAPVESVTKPNQEWRTGQYPSPSAIYWANTLRDPSGMYTSYDGIPPDSAVSGFSFKSPGLPVIVISNFRGDAPLSIAFPDEPPGEISALLKPLRQFPANTVQGTTIGPNIPPSTFIPVDFLDTIISYKHQSFDLGWIDNQGVVNSLDAKLDNAKKQLERDNKTAAINQLEAFVNEVEAQKDKHLSNEAYALLKFNAEYLIEKLSEP